MAPLAGPPRGTRSGDIDPAIVTYLMRTGMSADEIEHLLNRESGMKGLSGLSGDTREIPDAANAGDPKAMLAAEILTYRLRTYIGAYSAALGGLDVLIFTGGIGENSARVRSEVCARVRHRGIWLDAEKNASRGAARMIALEDSPVEAWVIPANEELNVARRAMKLLRGQRG